MPSLAKHSTPEVSFLILSYNYEKYIAKTIQSILDQTFQNFEILIFDDVSSDRSCDVVREFDDERIKLFEMKTNSRGYDGYMKGLHMAKGTWIANLDADDWIAPKKTQKQLDAADEFPDLSVIGTLVHFVDEDGNRHPRADLLDAYAKHNHNYNLPETWMGKNMMCRSSTMVRKSAHLDIGKPERTMLRAPDYELWTRFLNKGHRMHLVNEQLTYSRQHSKGVTYQDPITTFLEMVWIGRKNMLPFLERHSDFNGIRQWLDFIFCNDAWLSMKPSMRENIVGAYFDRMAIASFQEFRDIIDKPGHRFGEVGRRFMALHIAPPARNLPVSLSSMSADTHKFTEALEWYKSRHENLQRDLNTASERINVLTQEVLRLTELVVDLRRKPLSELIKRFSDIFKKPEPSQLEILAAKQRLANTKVERSTKETEKFIEAIDYYKKREAALEKDHDAAAERIEVLNTEIHRLTNIILKSQKKR